MSGSTRAFEARRSDSPRAITPKRARSSSARPSADTVISFPYSCWHRSPASSERLRCELHSPGRRSRTGPPRSARSAARLSIEDVEEPLLRGLRNDLPRLAVLADRQQLGRLRNVEIPQVVVNELLMPDPLAGARVDGDKRVGEQVVALAIATVEVEARAAEADERDSVFSSTVNSLQLCRRHRPCSGLPATVVAELPLMRMTWKIRRAAGPHVVAWTSEGGPPYSLHRQWDDVEVLRCVRVRSDGGWPAAAPSLRGCRHGPCCRRT